MVSRLEISLEGSSGAGSVSGSRSGLAARDPLQILLGLSRVEETARQAVFRRLDQGARLRWASVGRLGSSQSRGDSAVVV